MHTVLYIFQHVDMITYLVLYLALVVVSSQEYHEEPEAEGFQLQYIPKVTKSGL